MDRDRMFELRVLTGIHAGASALLPQDPQVLGSAPDCDLILSDEGVLAQHARLERQEDGSTVLRWLDSDLPPVVIRPGQGATVGPVQIAVEQSDEPWRTDVPLCDTPRPVDEADAAASPTPQAPDTDAMAPPPDAAGAARPLSVLQRSIASVRSLAAMSALAVISIAAVWWAIHSHPSSSKRTTGQAPALSRSAAVDPVVAAIARFGFKNRIRVESRPGQVPMVHASLLSDEEAEALALALSRLSPRPRLRLLSQAEIQAEIDSVLQVYADDARQPPSAQYRGDGRFLITGRIRDESQQRRILAELTHALPQVHFDPQLRTDAQAAELMLEDLRRHGMEGVEGQWNENVLTLDISLAPAEIPRWERVLLAVAGRHDVRFRATLHLIEGRAAPSVSLPFTVRSIVSSDLPYVVLSDGRKLLAGARVEGWQILEIRPQAVVFAGAQGRRITLER